MDLEKINSALIDLSVGNEEYAKFNKKIVNTNKQVIGVRLPDLRRLAKRAAKSYDFASTKELLNQINDDIYEQVLISGLIINQLTLSDEQRLELTKQYLTKVDSWALIDTFVETKKQYQTNFWYQAALDFLKSDREFVARWGMITLMKNFLTPDKIQSVLTAINAIKNDACYVQMAIAWLYATAAIDFYQLIFDNLKTNKLDKFTSKKACQKMLESYRISDQQKAEIRSLREQFK